MAGIIPREKIVKILSAIEDKLDDAYSELDGYDPSALAEFYYKAKEIIHEYCGDMEN